MIMSIKILVMYDGTEITCGNTGITLTNMIKSNLNMRYLMGRGGCF